MNLTQIKWLTLFVLCINTLGMVTPIINAGDSVTYAALSQYIATHNDWAFLVLDGQEWLDKPHFPFWITALSFKLFGISAFAYILPGFLFHLIGGYYTYRIARMFYGREAAWLSLLVYVSAFHMMYTSTEVKAETFLTGSIMAASYYWLRYDGASKLKYLLLGALFSGVAMMTKGVFTLITITSGLVCMWMYQKQWHKLWSAKWLAALGLCVVFTAPELLALYLQFDAHPEKLVFGRTEVSGIKFFLWDSQFGRFFNTGPIKDAGGAPYYFVAAFLWAFLPWVAVYVAAMVSGIRNFTVRSVAERSQFVYLCAAFFITFIMFSATKFQFDYYTVIIYPFAAILCGHYLADVLVEMEGHRKLLIAQIATTLLLVLMVAGLALYVGAMSLTAVVVAMLVATAIYAFVYRARLRTNMLLVLPVFAVSMLYVFLTQMATVTYLSASIPYNVNKLLVDKPSAPIYVLQMDVIVSRELALYNTSPCYAVGDVASLPSKGESYYLLVRAAQLDELGVDLGKVEQIAQGDWVVHKTGTLPRLLKLAKGEELLEDIRLVRVTPALQ
ncbi:MAG: glycosyltransferase family 39 protein [Sideroxydans sp.]|nr:glycosyltransferase family 39 protein [Sideroxydans sp.]